MLSDYEQTEQLPPGRFVPLYELDFGELNRVIVFRLKIIEVVIECRVPNLKK